MSQRDGYAINGRNFGAYYWEGRPGERRAASSAYADAKAPDAYYDNKNYMRDVSRGGQLYDQKRMSQDADAEDERIQRRQTPTRTPTKRTPPKAAAKRK